MMTRETTTQRHTLVKTEFNRLISVKESGVRKYSTEYIIKKVSEKTFYTEKTVVKILKSA
jgi:hypothetical protein